MPGNTGPYQRTWFPLRARPSGTTPSGISKAEARCGSVVASAGRAFARAAAATKYVFFASFRSVNVSITRRPPGWRTSRRLCSPTRTAAGSAVGRSTRTSIFATLAPAANSTRPPGNATPSKRAPTSQPIAGSFATCSKAKRPAASLCVRRRPGTPSAVSA